MSASGSGSSAGGGSGGEALRRAAGRLADSILREARTRHLGPAPLPDAGRIAEFVELARAAVFPGFFGGRGLSEADLPGHAERLLARIAAHLEQEARSALRYAQLTEAAARDASPAAGDCDGAARRIALSFCEEVPSLRDLLALDVQAAYDGDPAARHTDEIILCYPGVDAVFAYRVAHALLRLDVPMLPRIICEHAHGRTGIDIHPGARIGRSFFIDHGVGVVIGETAEIGDHVKIYQGVTLGAKSFPRDESGRFIKDRKRHPTIGNRVTIYAGAVILGGDTVVGDDCVISGGVFVTESVPSKHIVRQKRPELVLRTNREAGG